MNWTTIMVGLDDLKAKINKIYPKKIVFDLTRGDQFLYMILNLITSLVLVSIVFFS